MLSQNGVIRAVVVEAEGTETTDENGKRGCSEGEQVGLVLGITLNSIRATPMSFIVGNSSTEFDQLCADFLRRLGRGRRHGLAKVLVHFCPAPRTGGYHGSADLDCQDGASRAGGDVLERIKIAVLHPRSLSTASAAADGADTLVKLLLHCGDIVYLCRSRALDSTYADCIFYAICTLYALALLWAEFKTLLPPSSPPPPANGQMLTVCIDDGHATPERWHILWGRCRLVLLGVGDLSRPGAARKILHVCADHLLVHSDRSSWAIGRLLGSLASELVSSATAVP